MDWTIILSIVTGGIGLLVVIGAGIYFAFRGDAYKPSDEHEAEKDKSQIQNPAQQQNNPNPAQQQNNHNPAQQQNNPNPAQQQNNPNPAQQQNNRIAEEESGMDEEDMELDLESDVDEYEQINSDILDPESNTLMKTPLKQPIHGTGDIDIKKNILQ